MLAMSEIHQRKVVSYIEQSLLIVSNACYKKGPWLGTQALLSLHRVRQIREHLWALRVAIYCADRSLKGSTVYDREICR
jgi:hypothetical protein